jgi:hypothetical protein
MMSADIVTTFIRRILGVLALDAATFEEVEADRLATRQAMVVVVLASIGAGIGGAGLGSAAAPVIVYATAASLEATTRADLGQVLRTLGFAAAPGMFRAFEVFGGTRWFVLPITGIWMVVAMTIGVRQALDYSTTGRAIGLALLGWAVSVGVALVIGLLFSTPVS